MNKTRIAALILTLPLVTMSAKADVITDYLLDATGDMDFFATGPGTSVIYGPFVYDVTSGAIQSWNFQVTSSDDIHDFRFASGCPGAGYNGTVTDGGTFFEFFQSGPCGEQYLDFSINDPLFNGIKPLSGVSLTIVNESVPNGPGQGTLSATTVDEPSTLILFAFGALAMLDWIAQFSSRRQS